MTDLNQGEAPEFWDTVPKRSYNEGRITNIGRRLQDFKAARVVQGPGQEVMTIEVTGALTLPSLLVLPTAEQIIE
ncbi:MAG: hypothetical protein ABI221_02200 [Candidatus Saccharimonadales bacterium]